MFDSAGKLIRPDGLSEDEVRRLLTAANFTDWKQAWSRLREICGGDGACETAFGEFLPILLVSLSEAATPDGSLINFERFVQSVPDSARLLNYLASNPRAVEILVKLFVGSQFLTEILLRNPEYLERLTNHKRLAEYKSRPEFFHEAEQSIAGATDIDGKLDALRRFQHWELLRIGACDAFGLFDLRYATRQLSLLADSLVQACLTMTAAELNVSPEGFAVLAFGKLGGEELNYSSDIDLVFVTEQDASRCWGMAQQLINALIRPTAEGFLYRVDMRLRPWGRSGSLVNTVDAHIGYLTQHGMPWEKQALLKARVIAGDASVGEMFLERSRPIVFGMPADLVRRNVRDMKSRIEAGLGRQGRTWGEVKSGEGSIRDVEFVTQYLQLVHGAENPAVRSINTLDGLVRLADFGHLHADEYRRLTDGYIFLRTIEHALQIMHGKQVHSLPRETRELTYLARRLDYPDADRFVEQYNDHCESIRAIFEKYIDGGATAATVEAPVSETAASPRHIAEMEASYVETFSADEIERHALLLERISDEHFIDVESHRLDDGTWQVTIVGYDQPTLLSMICGLLFVYGFNITKGYVFTSEQIAAGRETASGPAQTVVPAGSRRFVNVFVVRPPLEDLLPEVWIRYQADLTELLRLVRRGQTSKAQGELAKRVAGALRDIPDSAATLFPVEIGLDNDVSPRLTVLSIRADDTIGFLYELANSLALVGVNIERVVVRSKGNRVDDILYVNDSRGEKLTDARQLQELRAAVVLIKHFTHLLPQSPNPEAALLHFRDFLEQLFQQPDWLNELASLERFDVLDALARLLGVSNFLWEDFLRLQHANLFPVVRNPEALTVRKSRERLEQELRERLDQQQEFAARCAALNAFKDREMFRADMRHILGYTTAFGEFSAELTDLAEVVVSAACLICREQLAARFGTPREADGRESPLSICALGKCGGRELGFASDIELMFLYEPGGRTNGTESISTAEYCQRLVEMFRQTIQARQEGIFQIDLRLRPYGRAGILAVSLEAFENYFMPDGAAWPYERQALVKLRPIAGNPEFGKRIVRLRDEMIYTGEPFDVEAMKAMRQRQVAQLVKAGTVNAKLSPGGLVDCEYLVQGLQISHGHRDPLLRTTNTHEAMTALHRAGFLSAEEFEQLQTSYIFLRRLIDALRMVRGHARDLTVPPPDTEEFEFLARRISYGRQPKRLADDLRTCTRSVLEFGRLLERDAR